jgi:hypothetical protein
MQDGKRREFIVRRVGMPTAVDVGAEDLPGLYLRDRRGVEREVTLASAPVAHCPTMLF